LYQRKRARKEVAQKLKEIFKDTKQPAYDGDLPEGNNGLGLMLLGVSGVKCCQQMFISRIRAKALPLHVARCRLTFSKESGAEYLRVSTEFALKMMGDVQQFFIENKVRNFYSVSLRLSYSRGGCQPCDPAGIYSWPMVSPMWNTT
jgi:methylmalonyl-CoA mutase